MVTIQNCGFMEFLEHNPSVWVPESKEEMVHYVYLYTGKCQSWATLPVVKHFTPRKAGWWFMGF